MQREDCQRKIEEDWKIKDPSDSGRAGQRRGSALNISRMGTGEVSLLRSPGGRSRALEHLESVLETGEYLTFQEKQDVEKLIIGETFL